MPPALAALVIANVTGAVTPTAAEASPKPTALTARTLTWYVAPGVRPVSVSGGVTVAGLIATHVKPLVKLTS